MSSNAVRIFVGNLPSDVRTKDVEDIFYKFGKIRGIDIKVPPRPPAFAFIQFEDPRDAEDAVRDRNGYEYMGARLRVEVASGRRRHEESGNYSRGMNNNTGNSKYGPNLPGDGKYMVKILDLPSSASWQDLKDHMRKAGDVIFAKVDGRGAGYVEYSNREDMYYAVEKLDDTEFRGRYASSYIRVKLYSKSYSASRSRSRSPSTSRSASKKRGADSRGRRGSNKRRSRSRSYNRNRKRRVNHDRRRSRSLSEAGERGRKHKSSLSSERSQRSHNKSRSSSYRHSRRRGYLADRKKTDDSYDSNRRNSEIKRSKSASMSSYQKRNTLKKKSTSRSRSCSRSISKQRVNDADNGKQISDNEQGKEKEETSKMKDKSPSKNQDGKTVSLRNHSIESPKQDADEQAEITDEEPKTRSKKRDIPKDSEKDENNETDWNAMKVIELRDELRSRDLDTKGTKAELVKRLANFTRQN